MSSLSVVHAQLVARMRLRAHRAPSAGVTFSAEELIERARTTHEGICSLAMDIKSTLAEEHELLADFFAFAGEWLKFEKRLAAKETMGRAAETIDEFDRRYRRTLAMYQGLGHRPTVTPPNSYQEMLSAQAKALPTKPLPIGKLAVAGGVTAALFFWMRRARGEATKPDPTPIRVGPPAPLDPSAPADPH